MANRVNRNSCGSGFRRKAFALSTFILLLSIRVYSEPKNSADTAASIQPFLGRWDLTLKTPLREYPSWLEITQEDGQLKARFVSRWGHARPLPKIEISNDRITFVSPKEEEDRKDDMVFEGKLSGQTLVGTTTGPDGTPWQWTGERAPSLKRTSAPKWGKPTPAVQRQGSERVEDERSESNADMEDRKRNAGESRTWPRTDHRSQV